MRFDDVPTRILWLLEVASEATWDLGFADSGPKQADCCLICRIEVRIIAVAAGLRCFEEVVSSAICRAVLFGVG